MNINKVLKIMKELSIKAGKEVLKIYEKEDVEIEYKEDNSPLTLADKEANRIICEGLKNNDITSAASILSEENKDKKESYGKEYCFVIDPIDGTKEFINKTGEFTINIGLVKNQKVVAGVIYVPTKEELYFASKDKGAYITTKNMKTRKLEVSTRKENLILVGSKSHASEKLKKLIENNQEKIKNVKSAGSSLKGLMVASGKADVYYRFGYTCEWDTCAMHIIVEEAGGIFREIDGSEMVYNRMNHLNKKGFYIVNNKSNLMLK